MKQSVRAGQIYKDVNNVELLIKKVDEMNGIVEIEDLNSKELGFTEYNLTTKLGVVYNLINNNKIKLISNDNIIDFKGDKLYKLNNELKTEKRMYCLVTYNLSDIQKGIQAQHAVSELGEIAYRDFDAGSKIIFDKYKDWVDNWKTTIVLNGGTTNNNKESKHYGSLQRYRDDLEKLGVTYSEFYEPDLNDAMTAVAFLVDMVEDSHIVQYLKSMNLA